MPRKWRGEGGKEDRECDGRTGLRGVWKEWGGGGGEWRTTAIAIRS